MGQQKSMNCSSFRQCVYHFLADEVDGAERSRMEDHRDACPPCARYLEVEASFGRFVRARIGRETAPPALRARIRTALEAQAPERRGWFSSLLFAPGTAGAAAALALALVLGPTMLAIAPVKPAPEGEAVRVTRSATVVDLQCEQMGKTPEQQRGCRHGRHVNVLKVADGTYWNLSLAQESARELVFDHEARGRRVIVEGDFYPELSTIRLSHLRPVERVSL
jgi:mycothiol system anti-sigma-R factor